MDDGSAARARDDGGRSLGHRTSANLDAGPPSARRDPGERALALAFEHLSRRERTTHELRSHLRAKGLDDKLVDDTVATLAVQGYVDDARFAELFTSDKRELAGWGQGRIERALIERGVERELVAAALAGQGDEEELERALALLRRRWRSAPRDRRERDRALGLLLRRGYQSELALEALRRHARAVQSVATELEPRGSDGHELDGAGEPEQDGASVGRQHRPVRLA